MPITKIHPIRSTLKKAIKYIANPDKTEELLYVSTYGCSLAYADLELNSTTLIRTQNFLNPAFLLKC